MGNTNSMNNMSLMDQRSGFKYSSEYLRYSQIPYEPHHHNTSPNHSNQMPHHHFKFKDRGEQQQLPNQIKVLPAVNFDSKLRITNNGAILHNGGTISNRKESDVGLHRSKSITETTTIIPPPYQIHRARTQMQINLQPQMKTNLNKTYASNLDLKIQDNRSLDRSKIRKGKAPMPPAAPSSKFKAPQTPTSSPPIQQPPPKPTINESKKKIASRMFGDTLRTNKDLAAPKRNLPIISTKMATLTRPTDKSKAASKSEKPLDKMDIPVSKPSQLSKINPFSHLRRERTFDLTLMQSQKNVKVPKKFSPQLNKKEMPKMQKNYMPERRQSSQPSPQPALPNFQDEILNATKRRSLVMTNSEKMKTIDKPFKKLAKDSELKKTNSAITSSTSSLTNSSKSIPSKEVVTPKSKPIVEKVEEEIEEPLMKNEIPKKSNFYFGMNSKSEEEMAAEEKEIEACIEDEQMDAINRFAEDIFKTTNGGKYLAQVSSESALSSDYGEDTTDSSDICLNLRPTLPRKQLQIPRFNPSAAWRSLSIETNLNQMKGSSASTNTLLSNSEEQRNEAKIERIYREPSFNLPNQQQDNKSGDSGISAGDNGNTPENNLPSAYLLSSWTPQQDLPDEEESIPEDRLDSSNKESENEKAQTFYNSNGNIFSLSLPRESHCSSEKTPQNNFYSLQKMKKSVVDVFGGISISTIHDKIQITNYGVDGNWLLSKSQPNSIDDFGKKEIEKISITHVNNNKLPSIMYLPSKVIEEEFFEQIDDNKQENLQDELPVYKIEQEERFQPKIKSRNHRFTFQSTVRQVERRKIAEKLSREAEEKEVHRLGELEAMQKVEEEFQKKRAREKASIRHQLRIVSLEDYGEGNISPGKNGNFGNIEDFSDDDDFSFKDTKTPYISKIIEKKSAKPTNKKKF